MFSEETFDVKAWVNEALASGAGAGDAAAADKDSKSADVGVGTVAPPMSLSPPRLLTPQPTHPPAPGERVNARDAPAALHPGGQQCA